MKSIIILVLKVLLIITWLFIMGKMFCPLFLVEDTIKKQDIPITETVNQESQQEVKVLEVEVSAYTEAEDECGKSADHPAYGVTASGEKVRRGIIAVDTNFIPLHSKVRIEGTGNWDGEYVAKDTGGYIKDNRIDIYVPTKEEAFELGRRTAKLYIIEEGK